MATTPDTPDGRSTYVGRVRKTSACRWVFEYQLEYPTDEEWKPFMSCNRKDDVLAVAIKAQLNGWIKEWHEHVG